MKTMICLILDRSGSMAGLETEVIGGVNAFIDAQKSLPDPACIAFVRFDSTAVERFRPMCPLADAKHLEAHEFVPRGMTPLLDAIGSTIGQLEEEWTRHQADRAIVVVVTDGAENASHQYSKDRIKTMISHRQESGKWTFIYLGANVDAFAEGGHMGFAAQNTANYVATPTGMSATFTVASDSVLYARATGSAFVNNLGGDIQEDGSLKPTHVEAELASTQRTNPK